MSAQPVIIGHRANSGRIVQLYKLASVEYVEIDVRSEGDTIIVGHGKPVINRATIIGKAWAWLDYKLFYRDPLIKARTLWEWIKIIKSKLKLKGILLDIKGDIDPSLLAKVLSSSSYDGEVYFSTEDHRRIPKLKKSLNGIVLASYSIMPFDIVKCTVESGADGVTLRKDYITRDLVKTLHSERLRVFAWTVNTAREALEMYRSGVDAIITDRPDIVRKVLSGVG